jgi:hypothetical protein
MMKHSWQAGQNLKVVGSWLLAVSKQQTSTTGCQTSLFQTDPQYGNVVKNMGGVHGTIL